MTMIEQVTSAILQTLHSEGCTRSIAENGRLIVPPRLYEEAAMVARAAIEAMRTPTDAMIGAAGPAIDDYYLGTKDAPFEGGVSAAWQAMIDAALNEQPETR